MRVLIPLLLFASSLLFMTDKASAVMDNKYKNTQIALDWLCDEDVAIDFFYKSNSQDLKSLTAAKKASLAAYKNKCVQSKKPLTDDNFETIATVAYNACKDECKKIKPSSHQASYGIDENQVTTDKFTCNFYCTDTNGLINRSKDLYKSGAAKAREESCPSPRVAAPQAAPTGNR